MKKEKKLQFTECLPRAGAVYMLVHIILTEDRSGRYFPVLRVRNYWLRKLINLINSLQLASGLTGTGQGLAPRLGAFCTVHTEFALSF